MSHRLAFFLGLTASLIAADLVLAGQEKPSLGARSRQARHSSTGFAPRGRPMLGTYGSTRERSAMLTRIQNLRMISPLKPRSQGLLPDAPSARDPIRHILERRNFLRARSPLGQTATVMLGRSLMSRDELVRRPGTAETSNTATTSTAPSASPMTTSQPEIALDPFGVPVSRTVADVLAARLEAKGEEHFHLGLANFRAGEFVQARHHFEMARDVWPERPQPRLGCVFASHQVGDYNRATYELVRAVENATSLNDLRIQGMPGQFWPGSDEAAARTAFRRTVNAINLSVKSKGSATPASILLAYYAWLNDDRSTALSAAEAAIEAFPEPQASTVRRFRDWLKEEGSATGSTKPTAR